MVDCGDSRCIQERRVLKKELLTWTKKIPLLIGLETVTETLLGTKKFQRLTRGSKSLETNEVKDWEEEETCCFCDSKTQQLIDAVQQDLEQEGSSNEQTGGLRYLQQLVPLAYPPGVVLPDPTALIQESLLNKPLDLSASNTSSPSRKPSPRAVTLTCAESQRDDTPSPVELKVPQIIQKMSKKNDCTNVAGGSSQVKKLPPHPPQQQQQFAEEMAPTTGPECRGVKPGTHASASSPPGPAGFSRGPPAFPPNLFLSEEEQENLIGRDLFGGRLSMTDLLQNSELFNRGMRSAAMRDIKFDLDSEEFQRKLEQLKRKHDFNAGLERPFGMPPLFFNSRHAMDCEKAFGLSNPYAYELKLPFLQQLIKKFAEQRVNYERNQQEEEHRMKLTAKAMGAALPAHQTFVPELVLPNGGGARTGCMPSSMRDRSNSPVELKVPSYRPMRTYNSASFNMGISREDSPSRHSPCATGTSKIGDTLKDIIAKSIAQRMRSRSQMNGAGLLLHDNMDAYDHGRFGATSYPTDSNVYHCQDVPSSTDEPYNKRFKTSPVHCPEQTDQDGENSEKQESSDGDSKPRKTRPKRGQYRKYNSELLLEAVRAVQRGEMSVHRAGSYFGVPHSTLEYKVKERHLLRQRKPRETRKRPAEDQNGSDLCSKSMATTSSNSTVTAAKTMALEIKTEECSSSASSSSGSVNGSDTPTTAKDSPVPPVSLLSANTSSSPSLPGTFHMGSPLPMSFPWSPVMPGSALPFSPHSPTLAPYTPNFGVNTSASDLLKQLQKKVQAKTLFGEATSSDMNGRNFNASPLSPSQGKLNFPMSGEVNL